MNNKQPPKYGATINLLSEFSEGLLTGLLLLGWAAVLLPLTGLIWASLVGACEMLTSTSEQNYVASHFFAAWNSFSTCAVAAIVATAIALPCGMILARGLLPHRKLWWGVIAVMACTPLYITSTAWVNLFGLDYLAAGNPLLQVIICGMVMGIAYSPVAVVLSACGFISVPAEVEEAALLDAPPRKVFYYVTLPQSLWGCVAGALLVAILSAGEITVTDALFLNTYAEKVYISFHENMSLSRAAGTMLPLNLAVIAGCALLAPQLRKLTELPLDRFSMTPRKPKTGTRLSAMVVMSLIAAVYILPIANLGYYAIAEGGRPVTQAIMEPPTSSAAQHTIERPWYQQIGITGTSTILAMAGASLSLLLALPTAWLLRTGTNRSGGRMIWLALLIMLATPPPLIGMALLKTWRSPLWGYFAEMSGISVFEHIPRAIGDSPLIIVLLYACRTVSPAMIILWSSFRQIPEDLVSQARIDGARWPQMLRMIALPMCLPAIIGAWFLSYILSFSELGGAIVTVPPGLPLFSVRFATQIHFGVYPDLARLAMLPFVMAIFAGALILAGASRARSGNK